MNFVIARQDHDKILQFLEGRLWEEVFKFLLKGTHDKHQCSICIKTEKQCLTAKGTVNTLRCPLVLPNSFCEGSYASPACPSNHSNIKIKCVCSVGRMITICKHRSHQRKIISSATVPPNIRHGVTGGS
jgi:hypothetical protein